MSEKPKPAEISVVVPLHNKKGNLAKLYSKLSDVLPSITESEVIE